MATILTDTRPLFSRLTEGRRTSSWRRAIPAVVAIVAVIALLAYLAARVSSYGQQLAVAQRDNAASKQQAEAAQKRADELNKNLSLARSAGRTTVVMQADAKAKDVKSWGTATLGEIEGGKSWLRVNAYGLASAGEGKAYHAWMMPVSGEPVQVTALDPAQDGSAFGMGTDLPGVDQVKKVMVSLDPAEGAKAPAQVLFAADLPKLTPTMAAPAPAAAPAAK